MVITTRGGDRPVVFELCVQFEISSQIDIEYLSRCAALIAANLGIHNVRVIGHTGTATAQERLMNMDMNQQAQAEFRAHCDDRRAVMIDKIAALVLAFAGTFLIVYLL